MQLNALFLQDYFVCVEILQYFGALVPNKKELQKSRRVLIVKTGNRNSSLSSETLRLVRTCLNERRPIYVLQIAVVLLTCLFMVRHESKAVIFLPPPKGGERPPPPLQLRDNTRLTKDNF